VVSFISSSMYKVNPVVSFISSSVYKANPDWLYT
jgi:hypothetical protein